MDLNRLLSIIGSCIPVITAAGAVIAKEVLNVDPPETIYDIIAKIPPDERYYVLLKRSACMDISVDLISRANDAIDAALEYVDQLITGKTPNAESYSFEIRNAAYALEKWLDEVTERYKHILTRDVIENAFPSSEIKYLITSIKALADDIKLIPDPRKLYSIIAGIMETVKSISLDGYVRCLKHTGILSLYT